MMRSGKIKKQKDLKTAFNEVTIFYKEVGDDMLIDCFFVSAEKQSYEKVYNYNYNAIYNNRL